MKLLIQNWINNYKMKTKYLKNKWLNTDNKWTKSLINYKNKIWKIDNLSISNWKTNISINGMKIKLI